ncbi:MAG TPA: AIR synthase related protein, partial [Candidatus Acidoferrales bacterium]
PAPRTGERLAEFCDAGDAARRTAPHIADLTLNFQRLLAAPSIASKRWIFEQYDTTVRTNTLLGPGAADAAVVRIKGTPRALALSTDGNGRWCWLDPYAGAMAAVAEAARNVATTGALPIAATNCLNFGNPEKPEVMWQFSRAIDGIAAACRALDVPITGGNVSFYNETLGRSIYPTPVIGVLGVLDDASRAMGMAFRRAGDVIVLLDGAGSFLPHSVSPSPLGGISPPRQELAAMQREFSSSEYARTIHGVVGGAPPAINLDAEKRLINALVAVVASGQALSAHDVSDGGLAVALAESCFAATGDLGVEVEWDNGEWLVASVTPPPVEFALFGEHGARAVVSCAAESLARIDAIARQYGVASRVLGRVTRGSFGIQVDGQTVVSADAAPLREIWAHALQRALGM